MKPTILEPANEELSTLDRVLDAPGDLADFEGLPSVGADPADAALGSIIDFLAPRRAGFGRVITKQEPTFRLNGTVISTRGNILMITAQKKEGKSAVIGAFVGAVIAGPGGSGDTLRITADNAHGHAVVHLDTEQSPADHQGVFDTALTRAGRDAPAWLYSYGVKGMSVTELHLMLRRLLPELRKLHGGIFAILLDGVADFVMDPNDAKECNPFVTQLEAVAIEFNCTVGTVLHLNPVGAASSGTKSRGHLGSQLERKCETDIRLTKDTDGVTTMFTACARHAPILEKDGPRFSWDTSAGMHTTLSNTKGSVRETAETEAARDLADDVFSDRPSMRYGELISAIRTAFKCSETHAERKFRDMKTHAVIARSPPNLWAKAV